MYGGKGGGRAVEVATCEAEVEVAAEVISCLAAHSGASKQAVGRAMLRG